MLLIAPEISLKTIIFRSQSTNLCLKLKKKNNLCRNYLFIIFKSDIVSDIFTMKLVCVCETMND